MAVRWADGNVVVGAGVLCRVRLASWLAPSLLLFLLPGPVDASTSPCDRVRYDLGTLRFAVKTYQIDHDGPPPTDLKVLVSSRVLDSPLPTDPWGNPYVVTIRGDDFEIGTIGPDHLPNSADDFSTASAECPQWPTSSLARQALLAGIIAGVVVGVALLGWALARRRPVRIPRTSVN